MDMVVSRFDICIVRPGQQKSQRGNESHPVVVVSPDEMNAHLSSVIVAPMTSGGPDSPTRIRVGGGKKDARVMLDQLLTVEKSRMVRKVGSLEAGAAAKVTTVLQEMFSL